MYIVENLKTKISSTCDVLVCGGGIAGISAALAAARCGKRVTLLEKGYMLGGLATAGLVTIYLPLCDGVGNQVSFGIAEELLRLSISMGAEAMYPENWLDSEDKAGRTDKDKRFEVRYNAQIFAILAEQLLMKEGVEILYGTYAVAVDKKDDKIHAVVVENKSGRQAIKTTSVVDATGDCDIAYFEALLLKSFSRVIFLQAGIIPAKKQNINCTCLVFAIYRTTRRPKRTRWSSCTKDVLPVLMARNCQSICNSHMRLL